MSKRVHAEASVGGPYKAASRSEGSQLGKKNISIPIFLFSEKKYISNPIFFQNHVCQVCGKAFVEAAGAKNCKHGGKSVTGNSSEGGLRVY